MKVYCKDNSESLDIYQVSILTNEKELLESAALFSFISQKKENVRMKIAGEWGAPHTDEVNSFRCNSEDSYWTNPWRESITYWPPKAKMANAVKRSGKRTGEKRFQQAVRFALDLANGTDPSPLKKGLGGFLFFPCKHFLRGISNVDRHFSK